VEILNYYKYKRGSQQGLLYYAVANGYDQIERPFKRRPRAVAVTEHSAVPSPPHPGEWAKCAKGGWTHAAVQNGRVFRCAAVLHVLDLADGPPSPAREVIDVQATKDPPAAPGLEKGPED
jgi:hypothetical protein